MALTQISTAGVKDDAVTSGKIPANAVGSSELADNAVDTAAIASDAVTEAKIANNAVRTEHIVDSHVSSAKLGANVVTTAKIADANVTTAKLAADAVTSAKLADNAVNTEHIVNSHVTTAKLNDNAVTTAKIADDAVTAAKIADNAITGAMIQGGVVNNNKLSSNAVVAANIVDANVTTAKIADDAVTAAKLANTSVSAGSYGSSSAIPVITVDAQGRLTSASTAATSSDLVADTSPQLGGDLDTNGNDILMDDGDVIRLGNASGGDMKFFHSGTNGTLTNVTGNFEIRTDQEIHFTDRFSYETFAKFKDDGPCEFYYDNSKKIETTAYGSKITGYQTQSSPVAFHAYSNGTISWSNSVIAFNAEVFDYGSNYNTSNYRFTAPVAGLYFFGIRMLFATGFGGLNMKLRKNGSNVVRLIGHTGASNGDAHTGFHIMSLAANDYIDIKGSDTHGGVAGGADESAFYGYLIG